MNSKILQLTHVSVKWLMKTMTSYFLIQVDKALGLPIPDPKHLEPVWPGRLN